MDWPASMVTGGLPHWLAAPPAIWKRVAGGSFTGCWIAPAGGDEGAGSGLGAEEAAWRESLRLGPFSFKVAGTWAERVPWERSFCLLDGPLGVRIAEEMRLERLAAGTALSLTVDFALGGGGIEDLELGMPRDRGFGLRDAQGSRI